MMLVLRGCSTQSHYHLEILRMLITQYCLLPLREATCVFHDGFMNTKGYVDTYVPVDLGNEWLVRALKKLFAHMGVNKGSDKNTSLQSSAMFGIEEIALAYDKEANIVNRASSHKHLIDIEGFRQLLSDIHSACPFAHVEKRKFNNFPRMLCSRKEIVDSFELNLWFLRHKLTVIL